MMESRLIVFWWIFLMMASQFGFGSAGISEKVRQKRAKEEFNLAQFILGDRGLLASLLAPLTPGNSQAAARNPIAASPDSRASALLAGNSAPAFGPGIGSGPNPAGNSNFGGVPTGNGGQFAAGGASAGPAGSGPGVGPGANLAGTSNLAAVPAGNTGIFGAGSAGAAPVGSGPGVGSVPANLAGNSNSVSPPTGNAGSIATGNAGAVPSGGPGAASGTIANSGAIGPAPTGDPAPAASNSASTGASGGNLRNLAANLNLASIMAGTAGNAAAGPGEASLTSLANGGASGPASSATNLASIGQSGPNLAGNSNLGSPAVPNGNPGPVGAGNTAAGTAAGTQGVAPATNPAGPAGPSEAPPAPAGSGVISVAALASGASTGAPATGKSDNTVVLPSALGDSAHPASSSRLLSSSSLIQSSPQLQPQLHHQPPSPLNSLVSGSSNFFEGVETFFKKLNRNFDAPQLRDHNANIMNDLFTSFDLSKLCSRETCGDLYRFMDTLQANPLVKNFKFLSALLKDKEGLNLLGSILSDPETLRAVLKGQTPNAGASLSGFGGGLGAGGGPLSGGGGLLGSSGGLLGSPVSGSGVPPGGAPGFSITNDHRQGPPIDVGHTINGNTNGTINGQQPQISSSLDGKTDYYYDDEYAKRQAAAAAQSRNDDGGQQRRVVTGSTRGPIDYAALYYDHDPRG